jgi:hypothetical protein
VWGDEYCGEEFATLGILTILRKKKVAWQMVL